MSETMKIALIGGSGLGEAIVAEAGDAERHEVTTPFGKPSGPVLETTWAGVPVLVLARHGDGHTVNPSAIPHRANLLALKQLGATHVLASGAVGSLREDLAPRQLVVPDQFIDRTDGRERTFFEQAAVHVEFADPTSRSLRQLLLDAAESVDTTVHDGGCYVCMEGPAFSTAAESRMHRILGGDLIGMTALPEAKLAREAELPYALVALVTDYDAWKPHDPGQDNQALLAEIIGHLQAATAAGVKLMRRAVELAADREATLMADPLREALKLAIWSDKAKVPRDEVEKLRPIWGRYFE